MTIPRRVRRRTAVLATALALVVLAVVPAARAQAPAVPLPAPTPVDVRVMTFNIWLGGDQVDFSKGGRGYHGRAGRHRRAAGG
jgi:hypothetical protein